MSQSIKGLRGRLLMLALTLFALLSLTVAWRWSPLREWLEPDFVIGALRQLGQRMGPLAAVLGLGAALSLAVPLIFLTLVSVVAFGPWTGSLCILGGALLGAAFSHGMGKLLGHDLLVRVCGTRVNILSQSMARHGLIAVIALRLVPVAPFAIVNMAAGATHLRLRHMLLGTAVGMCPATLGIALFTDQIMLSLKQPGPVRYALLALTVALIAAGVWGLRRWLRKHHLGIEELSTDGMPDNAGRHTLQ
jgi:uncharacterized membrane protein YdjX (TVP38/TMEM64 family)